MINFLDALENLLKQDDRLVAEDGSVIKSKAYDLGVACDTGLLKLLLNNEDTNAHFFKDIDGIMVFDSLKFGWVITSKEFLPDSYTKYKNKIGLVDRYGRSISQSKDICLAWPYKDCVLEGGQTKEDQKRDEIFYNEILAPDEVNRLLYPKVFTNAKKYTADGVSKTTEITDNDNLIIKGNNLLALSSLLKRYEGKVKCIYIDPPFNTGEDSFNYNDKFNHSSWLTFMNNRLMLANKLLKQDGLICVNIGNEEVSYVQILLDEVFGRENCLNHITMTTNDPSGFKATSSKIFSTSNHLLIYAKNFAMVSLNKLYLKKEYDSNYKFVLLNPDAHYSEWKYSTIVEKICMELNMERKEFNKSFTKTQQKEQIADFANKHKEQVFRTAAIGGGALAKRKETIIVSKANKGKVYQHPNEDVEGFYILNGEGIVFWGNLYREIDGEAMPTTALTDVWTDISWTGIANEGNVKLKNGKKPELLLRRVLELTTIQNDIIMDYHLGSGTTCAVAHKLGLRYIGIEQLDYNENDSIVRLKNVINGDSTGISKAVNWQGGGSFIYCELKELNEKYIAKAQTVSSEKELLDLFAEVKETGFISQKVKPSDINTVIKEFTDLSFEQKKQVFVELINKNMLYVNYCDIDDEDFNVSEEDKAFTNSFYRRG